MDESKRGVLTVRSEGSEPQTFKLRRDVTILGRQQADVLIADTEISSTHCQIQRIQGAYHLFDMNSTNGTFVNGAKVIKHMLHHGDVITIGKTEIEFLLQPISDLNHLQTVMVTPATKNIRQGERPSVVQTYIQSSLTENQIPRLELTVVYPDSSVEKHVFDQAEISIGRAANFGKLDSDSELSRVHFIIRVNGSGEIFVEDRGSTNGTHINGLRVAGMMRAASGDTIQAGHTRITLRLLSG